jgi:hypothetical protein
MYTLLTTFIIPDDYSLPHISNYHEQRLCQAIYVLYQYKTIVRRCCRRERHFTECSSMAAPGHESISCCCSGGVPSADRSPLNTFPCRHDTTHTTIGTHGRTTARMMNRMIGRDGPVPFPGQPRQSPLHNYPPPSPAFTTTTNTNAATASHTKKLHQHGGEMGTSWSDDNGDGRCRDADN